MVLGSNRLPLSVVNVLTVAAVHPARVQRSDTVSVGGQRFEFVRMGTGSPTVVLESGGGESASEWNPVLRDLAALTRVFAYSRTGHGVHLS